MDGENGEENTPPAAEDEGGGGSAGGRGDGADDADSAGSEGERDSSGEEDEEMFDVSLPASHSYLGAGQALGGRVVLEAGWAGRVPCAAHAGAVFPGESVPLLLAHAAAAAPRAAAASLARDKLFGLLFPDESGTVLSGYGVLCEVYEAGEAAGAQLAADEGEGGEGGARPALSFKARATQRLRLRHMPKRPPPVYHYSSLQWVEVEVLPERCAGAPLRHVWLASLAPRRHHPQRARAVARLDAALSAWPAFVHRLADYRRLRRRLHDYFRTINLERSMPEEAASLSFWAASNLALGARDRLALFAADDALLRLRMEAAIVARKSVLCCAACGAAVAARDHLLPMSSEGVHSNYTNLGGYMHDIVTVARVAGDSVVCGAPSAEFSWFPGYVWRIATCSSCSAHLGWRFEATRRSLRPQQFYGLSRSSVQPRHAADGDGDDDALAAGAV